MNLRKLDDVAPLIGTMFGGIVIGVIARNGFLDWTGETLTAGLFGLGGGYFALIAAKYTERQRELKAAYRFYKYWTEESEIYRRRCEVTLITNRGAKTPDIANTLRGCDIDALIAENEQTKEFATQDAPVEIQIAFDKIAMLTNTAKACSKWVPGFERPDKTSTRYENSIRSLLTEGIDPMTKLANSFGQGANRLKSD